MAATSGIARRASKRTEASDVKAAAIGCESAMSSPPRKVPAIPPSSNSRRQILLAESVSPLPMYMATSAWAATARPSTTRASRDEHWRAIAWPAITAVPMRAPTDVMMV